MKGKPQQLKREPSRRKSARRLGQHTGALVLVAADSFFRLTSYLSLRRSSDAQSWSDAESSSPGLWLMMAAVSAASPKEWSAWWRDDCGEQLPVT